MTEPAGPQLVPTPHRSGGAIAFFGVSSPPLDGLARRDGHRRERPRAYLFLWCGSAVVLWFAILGEFRDPARPALNVAVKWWLLTLAGPFGLAYMLYLRSTLASSRRPQAAPTTTHGPHPWPRPHRLS